MVSGNPDSRTPTEQLFFEKMTATYGDRLLKYVDLQDGCVGTIRGNFYLDTFPIHIKIVDTSAQLNGSWEWVYNRAFAGNINFFEVLFQFIKIFLVWFLLILVSSIFLKKKSLLLSFNKLYVLLRSYIFLNLPFVSSLETVILFIYLFFSLYFLEAHFFFIFLGGLSSDSFIYQFNFLLSSFLFIFCFKLLSSFYKQGLLVLSVPYHLISFLFMERKPTLKIKNFIFNKNENFLNRKFPLITRAFGFDFILSAKFFIRIFISIFFFFSTFLV